jgi:hypothetical protein
MKYPVITICGSMRYSEKMRKVAEKLTARGSIVLMPFCTKGENNVDPVMLDDMHKCKIDMSESIVVVGMHIGESTSSEIDYAKKTGKTVLYWTDHFGALP